MTQLAKKRRGRKRSRPQASLRPARPQKPAMPGPASPAWSSRHAKCRCCDDSGPPILVGLRGPPSHPPCALPPCANERSMRAPRPSTPDAGIPSSVSGDSCASTTRDPWSALGEFSSSIRSRRNISPPRRPRASRSGSRRTSLYGAHVAAPFLPPGRGRGDLQRTSRSHPDVTPAPIASPFRFRSWPAALTRTWCRDHTGSRPWRPPKPSARPSRRTRRGCRSCKTSTATPSSPTPTGCVPRGAPSSDTS